MLGIGCHKIPNMGIVFANLDRKKLALAGSGQVKSPVTGALKEAEPDRKGPISSAESMQGPV